MTLPAERHTDGNLKLTARQVDLLRCPACCSRLEPDASRGFVCRNSQCGGIYPIVDGVPVLIHEENSIFAISDFTARGETFFASRKLGALRRIAIKLLPDASLNIAAKANYAKLAELLRRKSNPRVLIVGGSILGAGMEPLAEDDAIELVETDVSFGPRCKLICDAHDLPFEDECFDAVIAQAVLEHVADPGRCVQEFHRVLRPEGLIYSETPFMQQVHAGAYDFTRFTHLGHRRLFRMFDEIASGVACGPGTALSWSYQYYLMSFSTKPLVRQCLQAVARLTTSWLRYTDRYLATKAGALDAASAVYFIGQKAEKPLSDRDLPNLYRGCVGKS